MTTLEVLSEARDRGLFLSARGDRLAVSPSRLLTPDFAGKLREFKPALLPLLRTKGITWIEVYSERLGEDTGHVVINPQKIKATPMARPAGK
jgi:hypothetical protein